MFSPLFYFAVYFGKIFRFWIMCLTKLRLYFRISFVTYDNHIRYTPSSLSKFADYAGCYFLSFSIESFSYSFLFSLISIINLFKNTFQFSHWLACNSHCVFLPSLFNFIYIFSKSFKIFLCHKYF